MVLRACHVGLRFKTQPPITLPNPIRTEECLSHRDLRNPGSSSNYSRSSRTLNLAAFLICIRRCETIFQHLLKHLPALTSNLGIEQDAEHVLIALSFMTPCHINLLPLKTLSEQALYDSYFLQVNWWRVLTMSPGRRRLNQPVRLQHIHERVKPRAGGRGGVRQQQREAHDLHSADATGHRVPTRHPASLETLRNTLGFALGKVVILLLYNKNRNKRDFPNRLITAKVTKVVSFMIPLCLL